MDSCFLKIGSRFFILLEDSNFSFEIAKYSSFRDQVALSSPWVVKEVPRPNIEVSDSSED